MTKKCLRRDDKTCLRGNDGNKIFVTPAQAGVGLNSVSNANQILTCSRSGIVNFIVPIPAYAGMTKHAYAGMTKHAFAGMTAE